jgi:hypothetical protein
MISKELFVKSIEAIRLQLGEDKVNATIVAEMFGAKDFCLYDNDKLVNAIIDLLSVDFDRNDLTHYCFDLNFGKPSLDSEWETAEMFFDRLIGESKKCTCAIPIPKGKVSENGISAYCAICLKDYKP